MINNKKQYIRDHLIIYQNNEENKVDGCPKERKKS